MGHCHLVNKKLIRRWYSLLAAVGCRKTLLIWAPIMKWLLRPAYNAVPYSYTQKLDGDVCTRQSHVLYNLVTSVTEFQAFNGWETSTTCWETWRRVSSRALPYCDAADPSESSDGWRDSWVWRRAVVPVCCRHYGMSTVHRRLRHPRPLPMSPFDGRRQRRRLAACGRPAVSYDVNGSCASCRMKRCCC